MRLLSSWSGGKDSCYALMQSLNGDNTLVALLNMMNENGEVSRSHGLPLEILQQHAQQLNVELLGTPATWSEYETHYIESLKKLKAAHQVEGVVFGDIDLQAHREWEEKVCAAAELEAQLPLWQMNRKELVFSMIDSGIKAIIVSCNTHMGEGYLGREITKGLVEELEEMKVDACGENGEYHTVVVDCPLFPTPIQLPRYSKKTYNDYCFLTWN